MATIAELERELAALKISARNTTAARESGGIVRAEGAEVALHEGVKSGAVKTLRVKFPDGSADFLPLKSMRDAAARQAMSEKFLSLAAIVLDPRVIALAEGGPAPAAKTTAKATAKASGVNPALVAAIVAALQVAKP